MTHPSLTLVVALFLFTATERMVAAHLEVGPGRSFENIEDANRKANPGDVILVYPRINNEPYEKVAVFVQKSHLTFRAMPSANKNRVRLSGKGFNYSGIGRVPRALFQLNKGADHCTIEGFDLSEAHNTSHNGAGVRINQANHATIRQCNIHNNDMGIMSNGDGTNQSATNQLIENCIIHHNGSEKHPGYNHNLYLGGTDATLRFCEIHHSLTGHNVKSRAHFTRVIYSYIHHSANREFDLVDSKDTEQKNSDALLMGNIIVKDPKCQGNRNVIHFGQDGGRQHDGTISLIHNTIITPFISPVLSLSASNAKGNLIGNFICDGGHKQSAQTVGAARKPGNAQKITGTGNWFDRGFEGPGQTLLSTTKNTFGKHIGNPFKASDQHNYRPRQSMPKGKPLRNIPRSTGTKDPTLKWQYAHPADRENRPPEQHPTLGAYGASK